MWFPNSLGWIQLRTVFGNIAREGVQNMHNWSWAIDTEAENCHCIHLYFVRTSYRPRWIKMNTWRFSASAYQRRYWWMAAAVTWCSLVHSVLSSCFSSSRSISIWLARYLYPAVIHCLSTAFQLHGHVKINKQLAGLSDVTEKWQVTFSVTCNYNKFLFSTCNTCNCNRLLL